jgi:hypothetical protein
MAHTHLYRHRQCISSWAADIPDEVVQTLQSFVSPGVDVFGKTSLGRLNGVWPGPLDKRQTVLRVHDDEEWKVVLRFGAGTARVVLKTVSVEVVTEAWDTHRRVMEGVVQQLEAVGWSAFTAPIYSVRTRVLGDSFQTVSAKTVVDMVRPVVPAPSVRGGGGVVVVTMSPIEEQEEEQEEVDDDDEAVAAAEDDDLSSDWHLISQ